MQQLLWGVPSFWIERFPLYYGKEKGFFARQGIDLEIKYYWGGPELAAGIESGEAPIGEMGLLPFSKAFADGLKARVIGSSVIQKLDHFLVAKPEIESLKQLKGKRVGLLSIGSCDDYFLKKMLSTVGLDADKDIEKVPMGDRYGRLETVTSGNTDAAFVVEPYVSLGESRGVIRVLHVVGEFYPTYQWGVIVASDTMLKENPDLLQRAITAFRQSCLSLSENIEEAAAIGGEVFEIETDAFRKSLERNLPSWELNAQLDKEGMQNCFRIQKEMGAVPQNFDFRDIANQL